VRLPLAIACAAAPACGRVAFDPVACVAQDVTTDALDPARWTIVDPASPIPVEATAAEIDITLPPPPVTGSNAIVTVERYDLTAGTAEVELLGGEVWIDPASGYDVTLSIAIDAGSSYLIGIDGSDLFFDRFTNGTHDVANLFPPFDPVEHAHWRLRTSETAVAFETSPDGSGWAVQRTVAPIAPATNATVGVGAERYAADDPLARTARFTGLAITSRACITE